MPSSPPQNRPSRRSGSWKERSPRGGEQPAAGQRGQGRGAAAEPEHPSDRHHLQCWQGGRQRKTGSNGDYFQFGTTDYMDLTQDLT